MIQNTYECRDCGHEYTDRTGDHCPECGGADVILVGLSDEYFQKQLAEGEADLHAQNLQAARVNYDAGPDVRLRELEDVLDQMYLMSADRDDELGKTIVDAHDAYQNYVRSLIDREFER